MKILILGKSGMLGTALNYHFSKSGHSVIALGRENFDARSTDPENIVPLDIDAAINACGIINRRTHSSDDDFLRVNSLFPRRLADHCDRKGIKLIHVSTDCVFHGSIGMHKESDVADADDTYGKTKFWGEPANAMVCRTSIIGPEHTNHYSLLCWFLKQQGCVNGFVNHQWNGMTTLQLAKSFEMILNKELWAPGTFHLFGEDLTKYSLLHLIKEAFQVNTKIVAFENVESKDMRLRSEKNLCHQLQILPMLEQLQELRQLSDSLGRWKIKE